jgi:hypothetical protein
MKYTKRRSKHYNFHEANRKRHEKNEDNKRREIREMKYPISIREYYHRQGF